MRSASETRLEEVIVTGSLITDPNRESPSPIVISTIESLQQSGAVTLEAALNQMPQFAPSGSAGNGGQGTGGHATVNLHALGANRNLVLLDGRRLPLADIFGTVDINLVPDSILSSVQTITGGASAVYGSDAMSGVVNFISLDHFEGATFDAQYGNTERGDPRQTKASLALGTTFADGGGHALLSVGYTDRGKLLGKDRMPFFDLLTPSSFIGQGTFVPAATNLPNQTDVNDLFASYGAATPVANTLNLGFNDDGTLFTQTGAKNYKGPTTDDYRIIAGNVRMPVQKGFYVQNPLDRKSVFSKFDYEIGPVTTYGQILYVDSTVTTNSGQQPHAVRHADHDPGDQSVHSERSAHAAGERVRKPTRRSPGTAAMSACRSSRGTSSTRPRSTSAACAAICRSQAGPGTCSRRTTRPSTCRRTTTPC